MTVARFQVYYVDLLPALYALYAPQVAREQRWRQQAARMRRRSRLTKAA